MVTKSKTVYSRQYFNRISYQHSKTYTLTITGPSQSGFQRYLSPQLIEKDLATAAQSLQIMESVISTQRGVRTNTPGKHAATDRRPYIHQYTNASKETLESTLVAPASQLSFYGSSISQCAPNHHFGNRYPASEKNNVSTSLDLQSISTMLEVPAPTMLDVPARQLPTLDVPMQLAFLNCSNRLFSRTLDCIASGPSNPHDPGPLAVTTGRIVALIYIIAPIIMTIIQFAKYDYLRVCPRSPQCMYVVSFL
jgi:hypothetical protein